MCNMGNLFFFGLTWGLFLVRLGLLFTAKSELISRASVHGDTEEGTSIVREGPSNTSWSAVLGSRSLGLRGAGGLGAW